MEGETLGFMQSLREAHLCTLSPCIKNTYLGGELFKNLILSTFYRLTVLFRSSEYETHETTDAFTTI